MLGRLSLRSAIMLTLGISLLGSSMAHATTPTSSRPSPAELTAASQKLEQLGKYQTFFGPNSSKTIDNQVPHYQEYLYLYRLVNSVQALVNHYDDTAYLTQHQVTDQTFADALEEMQYAYQGCSLLFGLGHTDNRNAGSTQTANKTTNQSSKVTSAKPLATAPTTNANPTKVIASTNHTKQTTSTSSQATAGTATKSVASVANPSIPTTNSKPTNLGATTPATIASADTSVQEAPVANATNSADAAEPVAVPATGEVADLASSRRVSWPALIAVVITGAAVASIAIALIIHHEPRRSNRARRRY